MWWVFSWRGDMTQQLQPVQTHLSLLFATVPAPNVRTADAFENGILKLTPSAMKQVPLQLLSFPTSLHHKLQFIKT